MATLFGDLVSDFRLAARLLRKDRAFTVVAVGILAVAIGGNATLFVITDGLERRGLPVDAPDRMTALGAEDSAGRPLGLSIADLDDVRSADAFAGVAAYAGAGANITERDLAADRVSGAFISGNTFALLGERAIVGREFAPEDDRTGAPPVCIIGYAIWQERYGASSRIVGRTIAVNGVPTTIVGVMRKGFRYPLVHDLWLPLASMPGLDSQKREARNFQVLGRLAAGVSLAHAQAELDTIAARLAREYPATNDKIRFVVRPFTGGFELNNPWTAMLGAVSLVLVIACANVANLLLARGARRTHEIAVRAALGATRTRIVRQLLVEHVVIASLAGTIGFGLAAAGVRLWIASLPAANWPYWYRWTLDARVVVYLAAVTVGCVLLFGVGPALHAAKRDPGAHLTEAGRSGALSSTARRWSTALLALEFTLTLALLAGAGLMLRTLAAVYRADAVVDTSPLLIASCNLPPQKYAIPDQRTAFFRRVEERLAAIPAVSAASMMSALPFFTAPERILTIEGRSASDATHASAVSYVAIGDGYFDALNVHLVGGRPFTSGDGLSGREAAIVNQRFASMYFRDGGAIGHRIGLADPNRPHAAVPWLTIVGISPTVRQHYAQEIDPVVYVPYRSDANPAMSVVVRAHANAASLAPLMRAEIRGLDPDLPLFSIMPLNRLVEGSRFANQVFAVMFGVFAMLALVVSAVGLFAVTSYAVAQRTREIGVRIALGAQAGQIAWLFVARMLLPLAVGIAAGLVAAFGVGRFIESMLIQTPPDDPATLTTITLLLAAVAVAATFWPARRAARLDPIEALRRE